MHFPYSQEQQQQQWIEIENLVIKIAMLHVPPFCEFTIQTLCSACITT
ncbi:hypothetical protein PP707_05150 [Acetobacter pasteurianus]|nr:hypothetical protein [Acetobacter pasteurianus]